jgi:hypothetical protein
MDLQASFGVLSEVIEQYESRGRSVRNVEATAVDSGERLRSTLSVPLCLCAPADDESTATTPAAATLTEDGLQVDFDVEAPTLPETDAATVTVTDRSVRVDDANEVVLTVDLVVEPAETDSGPAITGTLADSDPGPDGDAAAGSADLPSDADDTAPADSAVAADGESIAAADADPDGLAAVRDESVPPYEDEPYLRRLYEVCDTFDEMRREIPMDVSAETVRRYMIEAGVHDPTTYDTASERDGDDAAAEAGRETTTADGEAAVDPLATVPDEQLLADGIGLPAELSIEDVADAVVEAGTMYEVRERLDLDPRQTRELLQQLDLIDLVMRRIGDDTPREVTHETVADRLRECARPGPDAPTAT